MAVRNFWIDGNIDGRNTPLSGGPRSKDGGFELHIYQRDDGAIVSAATITGWAGNDGKLILRVNMRKNDDVQAAGDEIKEIEFRTKR